MNSPFNFIRTEYSAFIALFLVMAVQVEHNATIFERANLSTPGMGWAYAIAIEYAIIHFVANGPTWAGRTYAVSSLLANVFYYCFIDGFFIFNPIGIFISVTLSVSLLAFSESLVRTMNKRNSQRVHAPVSVLHIERHSCEECGAEFDTKAQLNGHISAHKRERNKSEAV